MLDLLTAEEQEAAERTAAAIEELRSESRRRLAAEQRDPRAKERRRANVVRAYDETNASA